MKVLSHSWVGAMLTCATRMNCFFEKGGGSWERIVSDPNQGKILFLMSLVIKIWGRSHEIVHVSCLGQVGTWGRETAGLCG